MQNYHNKHTVKCHNAKRNWTYSCSQARVHDIELSRSERLHHLASVNSWNFQSICMWNCCTSSFRSPGCWKQAQRAIYSASVSYFFLNDMCQINYLKIYCTNLHQTFRVGRAMAVNDQPEISFSIPQRKLLWQSIFVGLTTKMTFVMPVASGAVGQANTRLCPASGIYFAVKHLT